MNSCGLDNLEYLYDPCSKVFQSGATISVEENPLICNCEFYSLIKTGLFTIHAKCAGLTGYEKENISMRAATDSPGAHYYEEDTFHIKAEKECEDNVTEWNMSCGQWVPYQQDVNRAFLSITTDVLMTLALVIVTLILA